MSTGERLEDIARQLHEGKSVSPLTVREFLSWFDAQRRGYWIVTRIREALANDELSIGDYVLTNGALPAMVVIDAVARLLPGVLGDDTSSHDESFSAGMLEYPQYTRPAEFRGMKVPEVLVSGNHAEIAKWRAEHAKLRTKARRPDLM